uniref:Uncharacterized protein n=1 Tax=Ditylenchus dipsaci TaxID=166011 RepID=A0A915E7E1_9BILA
MKFIPIILLATVLLVPKASALWWGTNPGGGYALAPPPPPQPSYIQPFTFHHLPLYPLWLHGQSLTCPHMFSLDQQATSNLKDIQ